METDAGTPAGVLGVGLGILSTSWMYASSALR